MSTVALSGWSGRVGDELFQSKTEAKELKRLSKREGGCTRSLYTLKYSVVVSRSYAACEFNAITFASGHLSEGITYHVHPRTSFL